MACLRFGVLALEGGFVCCEFGLVGWWNGVSAVWVCLLRGGAGRQVGLVCLLGWL